VSIGAPVIEILWSNRKLERSCSDDRRGARQWGAEQWKVLKLRLASLRAAPTLSDMHGVPGNCHPLRADRVGQFAVDLRGPYRLVFEPAHEPVPRLADGGIDTTKVTSIRIEEVEDYHGN
jgi:proteic killer suppression protein